MFVVDFVTDSVRKLLDTTSYVLFKYNAMKSYWGSGSIAPRMFNIDNRQR